MRSDRIVVAGAGVVAAASVKSEQFEPPKSGNAICFTARCTMWTERGMVKAQDIKTSDRLMTRDAGFQPVTFIHRQVCAANSADGPIFFEAGAIGNPRPFRVSQMHLIHTSHLNNPPSGLEDSIIPARDLLHRPGVHLEDVPEPVVYYHFLLPENHLVSADGVWSASWNPSYDHLKKDPDLRQRLVEFFGGTLQLHGETVQKFVRPLVRDIAPQALI